MQIQSVTRFGNGKPTQPKPWHKLDPMSRSKLENGELKGSLQVLIRLDHRKQSNQTETLKKLEEAGFKAHFAAGQVVGGISISSGAIDADKLKALHDLDFVQQIEVSREMFPEK